MTLPGDVGLAELASIMEAFQRIQPVSNGELPGWMRKSTVMSQLPLVTHGPNYVAPKTLCVAESDPSTLLELPQAHRRPFRGTSTRLRVGVSTASFVRHEFVAADFSSENSTENAMNMLMSDSPLQKLMTFLDDEMDRALTFEQRELGKWCRREFVITKDSPEFPLQTVLANLSDVQDDPSGPPSLSPVMLDSPTSTAFNSPALTTLSSSTLDTHPLAASKSHAPPTSLSPIQFPLHEKRHGRRFNLNSVRNLVRKMLPANGVTGPAVSESVSRWSCSTVSDSDWAKVSLSASAMEDGKYL